VARRSFAVRDVTEILIHWQAGRSIRRIARSLGVDRNTVRKYVALATRLSYQPGGPQLSSSQWAAVLKESVPALADPASSSTVVAEIAHFHDAIVAGLATNCATTLWQRLRDEQGLQASLRSFRRYLDKYIPDRPGRPQLTVLRPEPPPGQEAQIDFGYLGTWTNPQTSRRHRLWAFVMLMAFSRHMFLWVVTTMDQRTWLEAHLAAFTFFGGVPSLLVPDNLKPGVLRADLYDPKLNRAYEELARYYGTLIDPCRAGHPKDKPRVERPISYIRDSFWNGRTFTSSKSLRLGGDQRGGPEVVPVCRRATHPRNHSPASLRPIHPGRGSCPSPFAARTL
jgi:transposase